ncbi:MAG: glycosyltransferase family 2 protein [Actinomycetota bacterium]
MSRGVPTATDVASAGPVPITTAPHEQPLAMVSSPSPPPAVSVIVPTYNERDNIHTLLVRLADALHEVAYEIIVVDDDSPDRTWALVERLGHHDPRIQLLRRVDRRGLSSAVIDGMAMARGTALAVIDADLQHDEAILPELVDPVVRGEADLSIGVRSGPGGSYGDFGPYRRMVSWVGAELARTLLGMRLSDPMSGYFVVSRARFEALRPTINPRGFKVMLELLARGPAPRLAEIGYTFRSRMRGETKLSSSVVVAFLVALLGLAAQRRSDSAFTTYCSIAVTALSLRLSALSVLQLAGVGTVASILATEIAIAFEFVLHDRITFRGCRRRRRSLAGRLFRFHMITWHATLALSGLAITVERLLTPAVDTVDVALALTAATVGVVTSVIVSYELNRHVTWASRRPR